jgi:hypothetical protein
MLRQQIAGTAGEINGSHIKGGTHFGSGTAINQSFSEQRTAIAVIKRTINMCRRDRDEARCPHQTRCFGYDAHGHRSPLSLFPGSYRLLFMG